MRLEYCTYMEKGNEVSINIWSKEMRSEYVQIWRKEMKEDNRMIES